MLLVTCLEGGGAQRVVFDLATHFQSLGESVRVVALREPSGGRDRFGDRLRDAGVPVSVAGIRHPFDLPGMLRLAREVRSFRPDLLHAHLFHAQLAARTVGRLAGARRVVGTHHEVDRRHRPLRGLLQRLTAPWEDASVAVSQAVADHARSAFGMPAEVILDGIDLDRFRPGDRGAARRRLGLPEDALLVGAVGRLHPQKGLPDLVDAFASLARPDAVLVLAGEGPEEGALRARAAGGPVRFLGFTEDVPTLLAALDVLAMPSHWEGFGLGLAEALACGTPVVATTVDSLPEVAGDAAVLVPPGRPDLLAAALGRLLDDPAERERRRRAGPLRASAFDRRTMLDAYRDLYARVVAPA